MLYDLDTIPKEVQNCTVVQDSAKRLRGAIDLCGQDSNHATRRAIWLTAWINWALDRPEVQS